MISPTRALAVALFLSSPLLAQFNFRSYLESARFDQVQRPSVQKFLRAAAADGHLKAPRDRALAKRAWADVVLAGRPRHARFSAPSATRSGRKLLPTSMVINETEYNATRGFANDIGVVGPGGQSFDGNIAANGETDTIRFRTVVDGTVTLTLTGRGSSPIPSGDFALMNERGYLIRLGEGSSTAPATVQIDLPRGVYYATMEAPSAGGYRMQLGLTVKSLTTLPLAGTTNQQLSPTPSIYRFVLPADGVFDLTINGGALDSYMYLLNGEMSYMTDIDDDSRSSGTDAGLVAHLPRGTYFLEIDANAAGSASFLTKFTPRPVPALACNASIAGSIPGGEEDFFTYRVVNTATQDLTFTISPRGSSAITDSYLWLFDATMSGIMESDDDFAFVGSIVSGILPPATYYVTSSGYWDFGDYTIAAACKAGTPTAAPVGATTSSTIAANDGSVTFLTELGTAAPLEFQVFENTLPDAQLGIVDAATGRALGFDDDALFGNAGSEVSGAFALGKFHAIVKEYNGDTGSFDLAVRAPKFRGSTGNALRGLGRGGDFAVLVASAGTIPGVAIAPFGGFFQLNLATGFVVGPVLIPAATGELDFGFAFPPMSGAVLQSLHLNVTTLGGDFTNVLR